MDDIQNSENMNSVQPVYVKPSKANTWAMACHLSSLAFFTGIPFANIFGPLIIWMLRRDDYPEVEAHGKESLNFQISLTIYLIISGLLCLLIIGFVLLPVIFIAGIVFVIVAAVNAGKGKLYRYPFTIRWIR